MRDMNKAQEENNEGAMVTETGIIITTIQVPENSNDLTAPKQKTPSMETLFMNLEMVRYPQEIPFTQQETEQHLREAPLMHQEIIQMVKGTRCQEDIGVVQITCQNQADILVELLETMIHLEEDQTWRTCLLEWKD